MRKRLVHCLDNLAYIEGFPICRLDWTNGAVWEREDDARWVVWPSWLFLSAIVLLCQVATGCGQYELRSEGSSFQFAPARLDFGNVDVGSTAKLNVSALNEGNTSVHIASIGIEGQGFSVTSKGRSHWMLTPGSTDAVWVQFAPAQAGTFAGQLTAYDSGNNPLGSATISGRGRHTDAPILTVSANELDFGTVLINHVATQILTLTSAGTEAVTVDSATMSGYGFTMDGVTLPITLNPGQSATMQVHFDPTLATSYSGSMTIASTGGTSTVSFIGTGVGAAVPQLTLSSMNLAFGNIPINTVSTQALTLSSTGTAPVTVNSAGISGTSYGLSGANFPVTLTPGQSITVQVRFSPTAASTYPGTVTFSSNSASGAIATVSLLGIGQSAAMAQLTVSPANLSFGSIALNTKASQSITLSSTGTAAVTVNSALVTGTGFALSGGSFPATLSPGQTMSLQVVFGPSTASTYVGTVTIRSDSNTAGMATVSLTGNGAASANPVLSLSSTNLAFGSVPLATPTTLALTLASTGTSPVTVSAERLTGSAFALSGATFPVTLNPGVAITLQVQFNPSVLGSASGQITLTSNSTTGSTMAVALSGTGVAAAHQVTLTWVAPASSPVPVAGFNVYRSEGGSSSFAVIGSTGNTQTTYVDPNVQALSSYAYYVKSVDSAGVESTASNQVSVTIP